MTRPLLLDPWILGAIAVGALVRVGMLGLWPAPECMRDECIYRYLANGILDDGDLGVATKGWLAAPGYPYLLAWLKDVTGSWQAVKWIQIVVSVGSIPLLAALTDRVAQADPGTAPRARIASRWAAWMLALHVTAAWYSNHQWIETFYIGFLLGVMLLVLRAREGGAALWAGAGGVTLGACILFRGVATWLPPLFLLALLWPGVEGWRESVRQRARAGAAFLVAVVLVVSPWSLYASRTYGGFMITDATMGHVLYLGNNDFPPLTFDYGIGALTQPQYYRMIRKGRTMCRNDEAPVRADRCDVANAVDWATSHPGDFVGRVPVRVAQELNPHTFLTRHIRWGEFEGLPWQVKELAVLGIALSTALWVLGGTLVGVARGRGPYAVLAGGTIVYTLATAAVSYGLTRFRLPLEPLWMVWLAVGLADPRGTWASLRASPVRMGFAVVLVPLLAWEMAWFAPTGWPMFWR